MNIRVQLAVICLFLTAPFAGAELPADITGTRPSVAGEATEVVVAPFLIDVLRVNGADQSFTADLFVLLSWRDPRLEGVFDTIQWVPIEQVWNPRMQILNQRNLATTFPDQAEVAPDGTVVYRQRYFGSFTAPFDLHDFPLDRQRFAIRLVVPGYGPDEVALVKASEDFAGERRRTTFSISDWDLGGVDERSEPFEVVEGGRQVSGYVLAFDGRRHIGFWAGKAFVSVGIIVAMSWVVFWLDPKWVAPRLSVTVTSMLTLIAYRFLLGGVLPRLSYLTRMDHFLIGSTVLVLITVVQVTGTTWLNDRDMAARASRVNALSRWLFPAAFFALMVVTFWIA